MKDAARNHGLENQKGKLSQISMPHSKIKIGVRHLSFIGIVADLDGRTMFHALETVLFIEGDILFVLRHPFNSDF